MLKHSALSIVVEVMLVACAATSCTPAAATEAKLSAAAQAVFDTKYKGATDVAVENETRAGTPIHAIEFKNAAGVIYDLEMLTDGTVLSEAHEIKNAEVASAAAMAIQKAYPAAKLEESKLRSENGVTVYELELIENGGKRIVEIGLDGANLKDPLAEVKFSDKFDVAAANFTSRGSSKYFVLEPGYEQTFEGIEDGKKTILTISVTQKTRMVDHVETRVVEERETQDGVLAEVAINYFAIDKSTGSAYYFGEDVDNYKEGKVDNHVGSWLSGVNGAKYGLFMPGAPKAGDAFYTELAPKIAMDRTEITSISESIQTPSGAYKDCVKTRETNPLEPKTIEHKIYAPSVGLVYDDGLKLVKINKQAEK